MKKFEIPTLEIEKLDVADVITASGDDVNTCGSNACPFD